MRIQSGKKQRIEPAGLYAITQDGMQTHSLVELARHALSGGLRTLQYRDKSAQPTRRREQATELRMLTREYGATFIVNDDLELAVSVEADGVHFGRDEIAIHCGIERAIERCNLARMQIGISCYNESERARIAEHAGAHYVAFGACFPSSTKPLAVQADISLVSEARSALTLPVVAIGGITLDNAHLVISAGADAIAVVSALWSAPDIAERVRAFNRLFDL